MTTTDAAAASAATAVPTDPSSHAHDDYDTNHQSAYPPASQVPTTTTTTTTATTAGDDGLTTTTNPDDAPPPQQQQQQQPTVFKPPNELAWDARVEELLVYKSKHGNTDVPNTYDENPSLARWVGDQRRSYKRGNMAKHRIDRLEEIGFLWSKAIKSPWEVKWDARFDELQNFMYKYGQIGTTLNGAVHPQWHTLSEWAHHQRKRYKDGKLRKDLIDKLESIHFLWDTESFLWDKHYALLIKVQRDKKNPDDPTAFRRWVTKQRDAYHDGSLSQDRIDRLNEADFHWGDPTSSSTSSSTTSMAAANAHAGGISHAAAADGAAVPTATAAASSRRFHHDGDEEDHDEDDYDMDDHDDEDHYPDSRSRSRSRSSPPTQHNNHTSALQLASALASFDANFKALVKFKKEHGHLNVSHDHRKYAALASWCRDMRTLHRRKELGSEKKKKLKDLGFRWANRKTGPKASWEERFGQLKVLLRQHQGMEGLLHYAAAAETLRSKSDDPSLLETIVSWVDYQRVLRKHHKLDQDKISRLTAVGLVWDAHQAAWDARYKQLVAYTEHGIKPRDYSSYVKWEHRQRREYRLGTLNHDRVQRLNSIGFRWEPRPTRRRASNQSYASRTSSDGGGGGAGIGVTGMTGVATGAATGAASSPPDVGLPHDGSHDPSQSSSWDESHRGGGDDDVGGLPGARARRRPRNASYDETYDFDDYDDDEEEEEGPPRRPSSSSAKKRMRPSPTSSLDDADPRGFRRRRSDDDDDDDEGDYDDDEDDDDDDDDNDATNRGDDDDEDDDDPRLYQDYPSRTGTLGGGRDGGFPL